VRLPAASLGARPTRVQAMARGLPGSLGAWWLAWLARGLCKAAVSPAGGQPSATVRCPARGPGGSRPGAAQGAARAVRCQVPAPAV